MKILLADIHGALDNCPWGVLEKRYKYYEKIIPLMFEAIGVDLKNLEFIKGSDFEMKKDYIFDVLTILFGIFSWMTYRIKNPALKDLYTMSIAVYNWIEKSHKNKKDKANAFQKEFVNRFQLRYNKKISAKKLNAVMDYIEELIYNENLDKKLKGLK